MSDTKIDALGFIKRKGPILPAQLASELNTNILFASAILSEFVSKKQINITNVKRGGSPFYYIKGQEDKLEGLGVYLGGKLKEIFDILKDRKILREKNIEPWQRVALKEIKDFAIPLNVNIGGNYELFWKWYQTTNEEAKVLIKNILKPRTKPMVKNEDKMERNGGLSVQKESIQENLENNSVHVSASKGIQGSLRNFFSTSEIYIISQEIVRKNKEMNFVGDVPSNLGSLRFFIKFKDKKIITDSDFFSAQEQSNVKKLPLLFLSNGKLSRKAEKYINENQSGQLVFKNF